MIFRAVAKTLFAFVIAVLCACAPVVMKGYPGPVLPADQIARIDRGAYTGIEVLDGRRVTGEAADVLPGAHTVVVRPNEYQQPPGQYSFYSRAGASVDFTAEAGHAYLASVDFVVAPGPAAEENGSGFRWVASILDRTTNRIVAKTGLLPLDAKPRVPPTLRATGILGNW